MEQYTQLLIPVSHEGVPSANQIADFLQGIIDSGVVGPSPAIAVDIMKRVAPSFGCGRNPVTGASIPLPRPTRQRDRTLKLSVVTDFLDLELVNDEYDVAVFGDTLPTMDPLGIKLGEPYGFKVSCHVRSCLVAMSSDFKANESLPPRLTFKEDCTEAASLGLFVHPEISRLSRCQTADVRDSGSSLNWPSTLSQQSPIEI